MNKIIILILTFFFFPLSSFTCKERQKIEKITIHYVDLEVETPFQISCDNFENSFSDGYKTEVIKDGNMLEEFSDYLDHCNVLSSVKNIDVRVKIIITYSNKQNSLLCMDRFYNLFLDNKSINGNKNIIDFIKKQIKQ